MPEFADYHRTVIGYHGTRRSVAMEVVQGHRSLDWSRNPGDWLGHGIYFWEYAPKQAWDWAEQIRRRKGWDEPTAVVASMIRLGNCLDLLDPRNVQALGLEYERYLGIEEDVGRRPSRNVRSDKRLNCDVFTLAYDSFAARGSPVDTCRAVFVPASRDQLWPASGVNPGAHLQILVRNVESILGTWLVTPR